MRQVVANVLPDAVQRDLELQDRRDDFAAVFEHGRDVNVP